MKKYMSILIAFAILAGICPGSGPDAAFGAGRGAPLRVVATIFPEYDWVRNILGSNPAGIKVDMLVDGGADLHSYQAAAEDILKISSCDLLIYVGGESDGWIEDALREAANKDMVVVSLLKTLGGSVKEEEFVEGMEAEDGHEEACEEGPEYDEHVWLSLKNAGVLCGAIAEALAEIDPGNAGVYQANAAAYREKLAALDKEYTSVTGASARKTLLFGDRFPFRYLVDDYGLSYYAAFVGCSAETEASFKTIAFLAGKVDELGLRSVMTIERSDEKIARAVIRSTRDKGQQVLALDSMQSTTSEDIAGGASYLSVMRKNLEVLKEALK